MTDQTIGLQLLVHARQGSPVSVLMCCGVALMLSR
jgi:hypothetical protein